MGTKRKLQRTTGYATSDSKMHDTYDTAMQHQTNIDVDAACEAAGDFNSDDIKKFLKTNTDVVNEFIKHHVTNPAKAAAKAKTKKAADKKAATK